MQRRSVRLVHDDGGHVVEGVLGDLVTADLGGDLGHQLVFRVCLFRPFERLGYRPQSHLICREIRDSRRKENADDRDLRQGLVKGYPAAHARRPRPGRCRPARSSGMLGPNGAGKSTTVKVLTTLSRPDAGEARVAGFDVIREADRVRAAIGVIAQRSGLDPEATAREGLTLQGQDPRPAARRGPRQDVELARPGGPDGPPTAARATSRACSAASTSRWAWSTRPSVLFLDEPTTGSTRRRSARPCGPRSPGSRARRG